jgi:hypothetical protein
MSDQQPQTDHPAFLWKKIGIGTLIGFYTLSGLFTATVYGFTTTYADRIYPGVTLAGIDFSGQTWEAAEAEVTELIESLEATTVTIEVEGGSVFSPTLAELGVTFDRNSVLSGLFAVGRGTNVWEGLLGTLQGLVGARTIPIAASFDRSVLDAYVDATTDSLAKKPQNATLNVENGSVEIVPGAAGEQADAEFLEQEIVNRLTTLQASSGVIQLSPILVTVGRVEPAIPDLVLLPVKEQAQQMIGTAIHMEFEGGTYTFTPADIGSWLVFPEVERNGAKTYEPRFDDAKISTSIANKVARSIDIKMNPKKILITTGQVIDEGRDGRILNRSALLAEIKGQLSAQTRTRIALAVTDVPKTEQSVYPDFTLGLYEGKYIEVNLSKQMLYAIEGNTLVNSFLISSGLEWGGYATPTGTMYIMNKVSFAYSRPYNLWMPYWNGLSRNPDGSGYEGYGIHELPCFNRSCTRREGISHLGRPASHGCIRLGHNGPAVFIYDWAPVGTPVYIHR